jgi:hypothetical protein
MAFAAGGDAMGKRNEALQRVADVLVGDWKVTMTNAWFWEDPADVVEGSATVAWLDDAFLIMRWYFGDVPEAVWVLSRSDARDAFVALSYDERGVLRVFDMTFTGVGGEWLLTREDPDFYQRLVGTVSADGNRIDTHPDASEDHGKTWRKDFDLTFERRA